MDERQEIKSVKKTLEVLALLNYRGELTAGEVADTMRLPRTTAYRILNTLSAVGYVEQQSHSSIFRLTSKVHQLSQGFADRQLLIEVAMPLVQQVGADIHWPLALAMPRGTHMVLEITTDYDTSLAINRCPVGYATPMLNGPSGLCYLAYCDEGVREAVFAQTRATMSKPHLLENGRAYVDYLLGEARRRGFCSVVSPDYPEAGLAVPLVIGERPMGGIVMRYIKATQRLADIERKFVPVLQSLADAIVTAYAGRAVTLGFSLGAVERRPFPPQLSAVA